MSVGDGTLCPRCEPGDEFCECGEHRTCPSTWEKAKARGEALTHWPAWLGGCRAPAHDEKGGAGHGG